MRDTTPYMYRTASVRHITMCTIFIHGFCNQSSNTDPIVDPEEHESTFIAEDDKISTFTESFDAALDSVAMETNLSGYIPI